MRRPIVVFVAIFVGLAALAADRGPRATVEDVLGDVGAIGIPCPEDTLGTIPPTYRDRVLCARKSGPTDLVTRMIDLGAEQHDLRGVGMWSQDDDGVVSRGFSLRDEWVVYIGRVNDPLILVMWDQVHPD